MRLQEISALAAHVVHIEIHQAREGLWVVSVFLQGELSEDGIFLKGKLSHEYKVTKFHNRSEPRTWVSLDKAVRTLQTALGATFTKLDVHFQGNSKHEKANPRGS